MLQFAVHDVEVGPADGADRDADQRLPGPGLRNGKGLGHQALPGRVYAHRAHLGAGLTVHDARHRTAFIPGIWGGAGDRGLERRAGCRGLGQDQNGSWFTVPENVTWI